MDFCVSSETFVHVMCNGFCSRHSFHSRLLFLSCKFSSLLFSPELVFIFENDFSSTRRQIPVQVQIKTPFHPCRFTNPVASTSIAYVAISHIRIR